MRILSKWKYSKSCLGLLASAGRRTCSQWRHSDYIGRCRTPLHTFAPSADTHIQSSFLDRDSRGCGRLRVPVLPLGLRGAFFCCIMHVFLFRTCLCARVTVSFVVEAVASLVVACALRQSLCVTCSVCEPRQRILGHMSVVGVFGWERPAAA